MQKVAVRRLNHKIIAGRRSGRIANDGLIVFAEISGKKYAPRLLVAAVAVCVHEHLARTEDVTSDAKLCRNTAGNLSRLAIIRHEPQQPQRSFGILLRVERQRRRMFR